MATPLSISDAGILDRMVRAVEKVRERLLRASGALEAAGVPYAVVGGYAVAAWVATVNAAAVRNTPDVDILLRPTDVPAAIAVLSHAGFVHRRMNDLDVFFDASDGELEDAIHLVSAGRKVRPEHIAPAPDIGESEPGREFRLLALEALVRMKLTSFRLKDRVHLQDLLGVGLIDASWCGRFDPALGARLQQIVDDPDG